MIGLLQKLFGLLGAVARFFADRQLLDAGGAKQREADLVELNKRVEKAERAVSDADTDRTERLRSRFDRASDRK